MLSSCVFIIISGNIHRTDVKLQNLTRRVDALESYLERYIRSDIENKDDMKRIDYFVKDIIKKQQTKRKILNSSQ